VSPALRPTYPMLGHVMHHSTRSRSLASRGRRARAPSRAISARTALAVLLSGIVFGLCFLHVGQTARIQELTASRRTAEELLAEIEGINRTLEFRIEQAFSLERLARVARERLGMIEPTVIRYVPLPSATPNG